MRQTAGGLNFNSCNLPDPDPMAVYPAAEAHLDSVAQAALTDALLMGALDMLRIPGILEPFCWGLGVLVSDP